MKDVILASLAMLGIVVLWLVFVLVTQPPMP